MISLNDRIKYSKYPNLILNVIFHSYFSLIQNRLTWFIITSRSQSPRALFQTLQPPNSITPPQHKKIYRFLYCSFLQRSLQPLNKFVHCIQPCRTSYNAVSPTDRLARHPLRPTFYLAVIVQPPSTQLNPVHPIQRIPLQSVYISFWFSGTLQRFHLLYKESRSFYTPRSSYRQGALSLLPIVWQL